MKEKEIWKDIPGYEGLYQVNQWGDIFSFYTNKKLKYRIEKGGYKHYILRKNKKQHKMTAHRAVALAFIPNPNNYPVVNHKDENPSNCYVSNLEWCTYQYNAIYNDAHIKRGNHLSKRVYQYNLNGELIREFNSVHEVERELNCLSGNICECIKEVELQNKSRKKHLTVKGYFYSYHILSQEEINSHLNLVHKSIKENNGYKVAQIDENNNTISIFNSTREAGEKLGISNTQIARAARGYSLGYTCHKYKWKYIE